MTAGFAEMTWRIVPPEPSKRGRTGGIPCMRITVNAKGNAYLTVPRAAVKQLRIDRHIELLVNGRAIALRAAAKSDPNARTIAKSNHTTGCTAFAVNVLRMKPGESFRMEATIEDGHCWAYLPEELVRRMQSRAA